MVLKRTEVDCIPDVTVEHMESSKRLIVVEYDVKSDNRDKGESQMVAQAIGAGQANLTLLKQKIKPTGPRPIQVPPLELSPEALYLPIFRLDGASVFCYVAPLTQEFVEQVCCAASHAFPISSL
jgi:hypothetical protein